MAILPFRFIAVSARRGVVFALGYLDSVSNLKSPSPLYKGGYQFPLLYREIQPGFLAPQQHIQIHFYITANISKKFNRLDWGGISEQLPRGN